KNIEQIIESSSATADLIVLPEMFSTGFTMQPSNVAAHAPETLTWMQEIAQKRQSLVMGSIVVEEDGNFYNRLICMHADGNYEQYDKRHLFGMAGEDHSYQAGTEKLIIEWKGWKICPLICYDLRFPVWSRNSDDYDLLIYVANWPIYRIKAWDTLLCARAIENQSFVIGVNRIGKDKNEYAYSGHSSVYDYAGKLLYKAVEVEQSATLTLEKEPMYKFRSKLPFLQDQDQFNIQV
ncbi:MAG: amidohydrolase, partial [Bacteroidota bacterium]